MLRVEARTCARELQAWSERCRGLGRAGACPVCAARGAYKGQLGRCVGRQHLLAHLHSPPHHSPCSTSLRSLCRPSGVGFAVVHRPTIRLAHVAVSSPHAAMYAACLPSPTAVRLPRASARRPVHVPGQYVAFVQFDDRKLTTCAADRWGYLPMRVASVLGMMWCANLLGAGREDRTRHAHVRGGGMWVTRGRTSVVRTAYGSTRRERLS